MVDVDHERLGVLHRAEGGGLGLTAGEFVVRAAVGHEHGVSQHERETHEPEAHDEHDHEDGAAATRARIGSLSLSFTEKGWFSSHCSVALLALAGVGATKGCVVQGTRISNGGGRGPSGVAGAC